MRFINEALGADPKNAKYSFFFIAENEKNGKKVHFEPFMKVYHTHRGRMVEEYRADFIISRSVFTSKVIKLPYFSCYCKNTSHIKIFYK